MQQQLENMISEFVDIVGNYAKQNDTITKTIKQHNRKKEDGYKVISCIIDFTNFKVRFAYHINEGVVFKKGIITLYFNIGDFEYHFSDILAFVAPKDKECVVYPYIDDVNTMKNCVQELSKKLDKYKDLIEELAVNEPKRKRLENNLKKEIKAFSRREMPTSGPIALMLSGIYSNTSLIRYTSELYEQFIYGNYKKAIKLYKKEGTLSLYEKQLVKTMERALKNKKPIDLPEEQKTISHKKEVDKKIKKFNTISFFMVLPLVTIISMLLFVIFSNVVTEGSIITITRSWSFLIIPTLALSFVFTSYFRDYAFKEKMQELLKLYLLYETTKNKKRKKYLLNAICIAAIVTIAIISASSISIREDGIKYSKDILDFKGTIVPYNEVQGIDIENHKILLENGEEILLHTFDYNLDDLKIINELLNK